MQKDLVLPTFSILSGLQNFPEYSYCVSHFFSDKGGRNGLAKDLSVVSTHWSFHVTLQWSIFLGEAEIPVLGWKPFQYVGLVLGSLLTQNSSVLAESVGSW